MDAYDNELVSESEIAELTKEAKRRITLGQYGDAEYFFKKITKLDVKNWHAWYGRGLCLIRQNSFERASYCFGQSVKLNEEFSKAWYNLGFCQSQLGNLEDALFSLNKAINIDSGHSIALVIKAWIYKEYKNDKSAKKLLDHVRANDPLFIEKLKVKDAENEPLDFQIATKLLLGD